jgi:hypothetical protein
VVQCRDRIKFELIEQNLQLPVMLIRHLIFQVLLLCHPHPPYPLPHTTKILIALGSHHVISFLHTVTFPFTLALTSFFLARLFLLPLKFLLLLKLISIFLSNKNQLSLLLQWSLHLVPKHSRLPHLNFIFSAPKNSVNNLVYKELTIWQKITR